MTPGIHYIEQDIGGNLGLAWTVPFWDWALLKRWMTLWEPIILAEAETV